MKYGLFIMFLLLGACSNLPTTIQDAPLYDLSYQEASQNLAKFNNSPVRWGGMIVEVENEQNASFLQVLSYPLGGYGRPQLDQNSQGRFLVKSNAFLDPAIYAKNTLITVAGSVNGDAERSIGKKVMRLPQVNATTLYLWPNYEPVSSYGYGGFGYGGLGYYPYGGRYGYNPFYWGGGFYRPYPYYRCR